jgi:hypothetical protein
MLKNLVEKLQTIMEATALFQVVYPYEKEDPEGTPFASITPSSNESAYSTTTENSRTYAFLIRVFVERKGQSNVATCETTTRALVDAVLDALDRNHRLTGLPNVAGYTYLFMEATPSKWGYVGRENEYRVAEIDVRVHFSIDVNVV